MWEENKEGETERDEGTVVLSGKPRMQTVADRKKFIAVMIFFLPKLLLWFNIGWKIERNTKGFPAQKPLG